MLSNARNILIFFSTGLIVLFTACVSETQPLPGVSAVEKKTTDEVAETIDAAIPVPTTTSPQTLEKVVEIDSTTTNVDKSSPENVEIWTPKPGIVRADTTSTSSVVLPDGRIRTYMLVPEKGSLGVIVFADSRDGLDLSDVTKTNIAGTGKPADTQSFVSNPSVLLRRDGKFLMVYEASDYPPPNQKDRILYAAISDDGINFSITGPLPSSKLDIFPGRGTLFQSVPDMVKLPNGTIRLYYVANGSSIASMHSDDMGLTWYQDKGYRLKGRHKQAAYVDPDIVVREDGGFTMYVAYGDYKGSCGGLGCQRLVAAYSNDGINFDLDLRPILDVGDEDTAYLDPDVYQDSKGNWYMLYGEKKYSDQQNPLINLRAAVRGDDTAAILDVSATASPLPKSIVTPIPEILTLIKTVDVTPDENLDIIGAFCRINYVPAADKFLVTFGGTSKDKGTQGYGYKWYTAEMEFTGEVGLFEDRGTDTASVMIDSTYYFLTDGGKDKWALKKYDPITWTLLGEISMSRDPNKEPGNDFMLAHVNGMLDAGGLYVADAEFYVDQKQTDPYKGEATSHRFFTDELEFLETRVLSDTPHINATSMVYVDGVYNMVTSTAFFGDLIVMRYDDDWNYIGSKVLAQWGNWPMGTVYDPELRLFFVTYISMENIVNKQGFRNIRLAVFDLQWNPITDIAVTQYEKSSFTQSGRPSVILHGGRAYVSYDISTVSPETMEENEDWECAVKEYEITQLDVSATATPVQTSEKVVEIDSTTTNVDKSSPENVESWILKPGMVRADTTSTSSAILPDGRIRTYMLLEGVIVFADSRDGLDLSDITKTNIAGTGKPADAQNFISNPSVVLRDDGKFLMVYEASDYSPPNQKDRILYAAISDDGINFSITGPLPSSKLDISPGKVTLFQSVPDMVKLPNGTIRLYYVANGSSIASMHSDDMGLTWYQDKGYRLEGIHNQAAYVDPDILVREDGGFTMYVAYGDFKGSCGGLGCQRLVAAYSNDGINFDRLALHPILDVGDEDTAYLDPDVYQDSKGNWYMLYGEKKYSDQQNPLINLRAAVRGDD